MNYPTVTPGVTHGGMGSGYGEGMDDDTEIEPQTRLRIVWADADGRDEVYWAGLSNGWDGQGWTDDHREALTFASPQDADVDLQAARKVLSDYGRGGDVELMEVATW